MKIENDFARLCQKIGTFLRDENAHEQLDLHCENATFAKLYDSFAMWPDGEGAQVKPPAKMADALAVLLFGPITDWDRREKTITIVSRYFGDLWLDDILPSSFHLAMTLEVRRPTVTLLPSEGEKLASALMLGLQMKVGT